MIAICSLDAAEVDHIEVDYAQDFTDLGNYEEHLTRSITVEAAARRAQRVSVVETGSVTRTAIQVEVR